MLDWVPKYTSGRSINKPEENDQNTKIQAFNKIRRPKSTPKIFKLVTAIFVIFQPKKGHLKLKLFISRETLFWFLRYSNFCNFRP